MRKELSISHIKKVFNCAKNKAKKTYNSGNYDKCLENISFAAHIAFRFNWIYKDDDLEYLLKKISEQVLPKYSSNVSGNDRFVFYDFLTRDNRGLTQQYIRAFISWNVKFIYIAENIDESLSSTILKELRQYDKVTIIVVNNRDSYIERIKKLYKTISDFRPDKIFLQLGPWSAYAVTLFNAFPTIPKYYIDLTDHSFNLGVSCIDYIIEFRNRGVTIANEKRGIPIDRILIQPYYPIVTESDFKGFPFEIRSEDVIIFSGGEYYKIVGDDNLYFTLLKELLEKNQFLKVVFATPSVDYPLLDDFIKSNNYQNRVFILGFRKDISQVFKHSDIYLNTYPFSGGLMCQHAAISGVPIIAYNKIEYKFDFMESIICDNSDIHITYSNVDDFLNEANKLINDKTYRQNKGNELKQNIVTPVIFNESLRTIITSNTTIIIPRKIQINYNLITNKFLDKANKTYGFDNWVYKQLKIKALFVLPILFWRMPHVIMQFVSQPQKYIKKFFQH